MTFRISIKQKFALVATACFVATLLLATAIQVIELRQRMSEILADQQHSLLDTIAIDVAERFATRQKFLAGLAAIIAPQDGKNSPETMQRMLDASPATDTLFDDIFVISAEGRILANSPYDEKRKGIDVSDSGYFIETVSQRQPLISSPYPGRMKQNPSVMMTAPIRDGNGRVIGVVGGQIDLFKLNFLKGLGELQIGKTGRLYIVSKGENPVYVLHPERERIMTPVDITTEPKKTLVLTRFEGGREILYRHASKGLYSFSAIGNPDWVLIGILPAEEAFAPIVSAQRTTILTSLVGTLIFAPLIWWLALRLLRPLGALRERILSLSATRNATAASAAASVDEIESLSRDFETLTAERRISDDTLLASSEKLRETNQLLEQRVIERTAQLREANHELEAFNYSVAHDLRTPLRAITSFSQILASNGSKRDERETDMLRRISEAGIHMGEIIEGLLQLSRVSQTTPAPVPVNLTQICHQVTNDLIAIEPVRKITLEIAPDMIMVCDPAMLRVIMQNLIGNAWKFTRTTADALIRVSLDVDEENVPCCRVMDNGIGFDQAHAGRLFKPFERLHNTDKYQGLGIGLATVERIVHLHGGRLSAEGKPGKGAIFQFTLAKSDKRRGGGI